MISQTCGVIVSMEFPNRSLPEKYKRRRKQFVEEVAAHKLDGSVCPQKIILADGRQYDIDKYHDPRPAGIESTGNRVMAYEIWMKGKQTILFEPSGRWWMLMKE